MFRSSPNADTVVVEPSSSATAPGGVKWLVYVNGGVSSQHNYKKAAVKKARQKARGRNGKLEVLDTDMNVVDTANYQ